MAGAQTQGDGDVSLAGAAVADGQYVLPLLDILTARQFHNQLLVEAGDSREVKAVKGLEHRKAGWHRANDLVVPENIRLIPLPPYSPQLNPVEHLWDEIREKWFTNLVFNSLDALEDRLVQALATLERDTHRVQSITGFDWIVNIRLNAP